MSYASYEQEQQDQEVFRKLVAAHKAKEERDEELGLKWIVNATPIENGQSAIRDCLASVGLPLDDTECEKK
jgi:hypothetical protein